MAINPSIYKDQLLQFLSTHDSFCTETPHTLFQRNSIITDIKESYGEYPLNRFNRAHFIGGGGVASWFLPQFIKTIYNYRIAHSIEDSQEFVICIYDYDVVENKNILRQNFIPEDVGQNKAKVLSERYNYLYPGIKVIYVPKYLYCRNFLINLIGDRKLENEEYGNEDIYTFMNFSPYQSLVFNFVDNETTKHQLDYHLAVSQSSFFDSPFIESVYFTTGCDVSNGQVFCKKFKYSPWYTHYYSDVTFDKGEELIDEPISCAELAESSALEQTFDSNTLAANLLNILVNNTLNKFWNTHTKEIKFVSSGSPRVETINSMENYNFLGYVTECLSMQKRY